MGIVISCVLLMLGPRHILHVTRDEKEQRKIATGMHISIMSFWSLFSQSGTICVIWTILAVKLRPCIARLRKNECF